MALFGPIEDHLPVLITELAPPFRVLTLAGSDRPEAGVEVRTRQRSTKTWYPGAKTASTQMLGTAEDPITLRGWFQDPLTFVDGGPAARVALIRGLVDGQNRCQLSWGFSIWKWGRVAEFTPTFYTSNRIRYEIIFDVDQAMEPIAPGPLPLLSATVADLVDAAAALSAAADLLAETAGAIKGAAGIVGANT